MLELDIILERYLQQHYIDASAKERAQFIELLEMQDPQLYQLVTGAISPAKIYTELITKISSKPVS
ncbi:MAG TPA: succinate dehydrogenase assembly factor 2 [Ectothiorhodospiraceae bacterium]|nr:succinate dehydrogenase assembly factor 2 [Ectothiorhodospiraceae bacterium]